MRPLATAFLMSSALCAARAPAAPEGVRLVGRWLPPDSAPTATYAGSRIELHFKQSSKVSVNFTVSDSKGDQPLYVSVSVDGGGPRRVALSRGAHAGVVLASGLSAGPHVVDVRKEGEPYFGALQFSNPTLDVAGRWLTAAIDRPVIEVIGDSDATGICVLGPDSPAYAVSIRNSDWAAESLSWVGLLEAGLIALGHPADLVDLAISGSKTQSEADTYDLAAPGYSGAPFGDYAPPGRRHASVVFLWGGGNDRHGGGDVARAARTGTTGPTGGDRLEYGALSEFQKGLHDQLTKIFARNPGVKVVMLQYTDPAIPDWTPAYREVESMFSADERQRILSLRVYDPKGAQDACKADPDGHPNVSLHASWAAQILSWMMSKEVFAQLGFPPGEQWSEP
jgi:hypothetical protein